MSTKPDPEQDKWLEDANENVGKQASYMNRFLDSNNLDEALKCAAQMTGELRTSKLSPKNYYELYMNVTNELREMERFFESEDVKDRAGDGGRSVVEMYENVQHAGNIIPRLYLLITVASVYVKSKRAPARDILFDLVELCRGVQHPMRGLFLRDYLSQMTKDKLPDVGSEYDGIGGSVQDSIEFILQNFAEMNKLWVRIQHQGAVKDRARREKERRNLRQLVGTNLVRLSQMVGITIEVYSQMVLPRILEQVINCKDTISQEYLMDCIIQVFPDDFHLATLDIFLHSCKLLQPKVNVKNIIIVLMNRLSNFITNTPGLLEIAADAASAIPEQQQQQQQQKQQAVQAMAVDDEDSGKADYSTLVASGRLPDMFPIFHKYISQLIVRSSLQQQQQAAAAAQPRQHHPPGSSSPQPPTATPPPSTAAAAAGYQLSLSEILQFQVALMNFATKVYPGRIDYVDGTLGFVVRILNQMGRDANGQPSAEEVSSLLYAQRECVKHTQQLLTLPLHALGLDILKLVNYGPLLGFLRLDTHTEVSVDIVNAVVESQREINSLQDAEQLFGNIAPLIKSEGQAATDELKDEGAPGSAVDDFEFAQHQGLVARMVHLIRNDDTDQHFQLYQLIRKHFGQGGTRRIQHTLPPLVFGCLMLAKRVLVREQKQQQQQAPIRFKTKKIFGFVHETITVLAPHYPTLALRLFLQTALCSDQCGYDAITYEFVVQAITVFEEEISDSRDQYAAITYLVACVQQMRYLTAESYDTIISKATQYSARLLKKPDQCRAVANCSHLFWPVGNGNTQTDGVDNEDDNGNVSGAEDAELQTQQQQQQDDEDTSKQETEDGSDKKKGKGVAAGKSPAAPTLFRDDKRVLVCLQRSLKIADACMGLQVHLFVEILNKYLYFYEHQCPSIAVKYVKKLIALIQTSLPNLDNSEASAAARQHYENTIAHLRCKAQENPDRYGGILED